MSLRNVGQALDMTVACPRRSYTVPEQSTGSQPLDFLRGISGSQTVAGQHNREPNSEPALWTNWIYDTTGKFPGLWSGDFLYEQDDIDDRGTMIDEAKSQWEQGALINLMYHAAPPDLGEPCAWDPGVINHPLSDDQWNDLITDGGYLNTQWKARLDVISVFLQDLKDSGVQVLWRPFHEMNQGEFWWGGRPGPQGTLRLYQITHDYMVGTKGLTNLTWVWDVQDLDFTWADYNPGDGYWDVFAMDMYGDGYTTQKYTTMLQIAGDSPIAIGECEVLPTADELTAQPRWTFFMAWAELVQSGNSVQEIQDLYSAANVITLGQMPGWGAQTANLYVFHQGEDNDGQLWYSSNNNINWTADTQVQNVGMSESPSAVLWADGISVFHQGGENNAGSLWYDYFDGTNWYGDTLVPNLGMSGSPSAVVYNGLLYVFHQGPNNDGQLWYSANDGTKWTADTQVQNVGMSGSPWAVLWAGGISVFHHGFGNNGSLWYSYFDGTNWYPDTLVPNLGMSGSPSGVVPVPTTSIDYSIWSLQEPSGSGTSPTTISPSQLVAGYSDAYFYIAADGGQAFMDTQTGITTPGSTHCRTELRELTSGGAHAAWAPSGTNTMDVTGQVTLLGGGSSGKVTVGQVYNSDDSIPLGELQYSASVGGFILHYEEAKGAGTDIDLQTPVALNTPYSFQLSLTNGVLTVSINGTQVYSHTPSSSIVANEFYFKCGNYDQTTTAGEVTTTPYTIVEIYSINVVHA